MFVSHNFLVSPTQTIGYWNPKAQHGQTETPTAFNSGTIQLNTPPKILCYAFTSFTILTPFLVVFLQ
jgi:hypothetical protein